MGETLRKSQGMNVDCVLISDMSRLSDELLSKISYKIPKSHLPQAASKSLFLKVTAAHLKEDVGV